MSLPPRFHVPDAAPGARLALPRALRPPRSRGAQASFRGVRARVRRRGNGVRGAPGRSVATDRLRPVSGWPSLPGRVAAAARTRRLAAQRRPDGAGRPKGYRAGRRLHLARGHLAHGRRGPTRPAGLAWRALGARRLGRGRAVRARRRARRRADHHPGRAGRAHVPRPEGRPPRNPGPRAADVRSRSILRGRSCSSWDRPAASSPPRPSARGAGFDPASLGPRILRAETAAVVAVAWTQALWGDLRA